MCDNETNKRNKRFALQKYLKYSLSRKLPYVRSLSNFLKPNLESSTSTPVKALCCSFIYICVLVVALFIFVHLYAPPNWFLAPRRHLVSACSMHESVLVYLKWVLVIETIF